MENADAPLHPGAAAEAATPVRATHIPNGRPMLANQRLNDIGLFLLSAVIFFGGWELIVLAFNIRPTILPSPSRILTSLWGMILLGTLPRHFAITLTETLAGFVIGSLAGVLLGTLIALSRVASKVLYPYIVVLQVIPKVAIAPLLIIWFGFGIESKIVMAVLISFFPLLVNTIAGLQAIQPEYLDLMTALTANRVQSFRYVRFPSALPFIFAGLEAGIVLAIIGALVGEFVGAGVGLGYLVMLHNANLNVPGVFAVMVVLAALGVALYAAIGFARRRIVFWARPEHEHFTGA